MLPSMPPPPPVVCQSCHRHLVAVTSTAAAAPQVLLLFLRTNASHISWLVVMLPIVVPPDWFSSLVVQFVAKKIVSGINPTGL
jgi:hypothetical protein